MNRRQLGKLGEDLALEYLLGKGYRFIDRNFNCPLGELDLILNHEETLVIVEVKTRVGSHYGFPQDAVTPYKVNKLTRVLDWFLKSRSDIPHRMRIDVVAIALDDHGHLLNFNHIKNVTG